MGQLPLFRDEEEEEKQEGRFSTITYLWLKGENVIAAQHGISSHLCPLTLEAVGEKSKAFLATAVHSTLLVLFLLTQPVILPAATGETNPAGCLISHISAERSASAGTAPQPRADPEPWGPNGPEDQFLHTPHLQTQERFPKPAALKRTSWLKASCHS